MELARHPLPVSSTVRNVGEQKAKVKVFPKRGSGPLSGNPNQELAGKVPPCIDSAKGLSGAPQEMLTPTRSGTDVPIGESE